MNGIGVFWTSADGRTVILRHCDIAFELLHDGVQVMPVGRFEPICRYVWAEFPPRGFGSV